MGRLILLRHAQAALATGPSDLDRPLTPEGRESAGRIGSYMVTESLLPDLVLVSPARRTCETWDQLCAHLDAPSRIENRIYEASAGMLKAIVQAIPPSIETLLMIGHNPGLEELARLLKGFGDRQAIARLACKYPTAGLAVIDFEDAWCALAPQKGRLDRFVTPQSLGVGHDD